LVVGPGYLDKPQRTIPPSLVYRVRLIACTIEPSGGTVIRNVRDSVCSSVPNVYSQVSPVNPKPSASAAAKVRSGEP
jgi:hypothetical protein